jgi:cation diffusion facilitator CzcD-associated flavoprotein CzcO
MSLRWPVRSVVAGAAGTTTMTLAYAVERRLRTSHHGQLDYDDSLVPGQIVASVMHLPQVTDRQDHELGLALRWGYGSAFGLMHGLLNRRLREPWASAVFGGMLMSATVTLFPLLGRTPPPWRWPADVIATSLGTHVAYVGAVAIVDDLAR